MRDVIDKILIRMRHKFLNLCQCPITVFFFHQTSTDYDALRMWSCDWIQIDKIKSFLLHFNKQYTFISLSSAQQHLRYDRFRFKRYAVLTADDGYKSLMNILPWLQEQNIPITLFINSKYLDGESWSANSEKQIRKILGEQCAEEELKAVVKDMYLTKEDLFKISSPLVEIGLHGHEHLDATLQSTTDFKKNIEQCFHILCSHPCFVPFFAYPWGHHNEQTDAILTEYNLIPTLVDGLKNYNDTSCIHRELLHE